MMTQYRMRGPRGEISAWIDEAAMAILERYGWTRIDAGDTEEVVAPSIPVPVAPEPTAERPEKRPRVRGRGRRRV